MSPVSVKRGAVTRHDRAVPAASMRNTRYAATAGTSDQRTDTDPSRERVTAAVAEASETAVAPPVTGSSATTRYEYVPAASEPPGCTSCAATIAGVATMARRHAL